MRLPLFILLVLIFTGFPMPTLAGATANDTSSTPGDIYLAMGDSIAAGIGSSLPPVRGYPSLLAQYLERQADHPVELVNIAVPGETTTSLIEDGQLDQAIQVIADARDADRHVSPITLTIGANDLLTAGNDEAALEQALSTVEENLQHILSHLQDAVTGAEFTADLIATTYYDPSGSDPTLARSDAWWAAKLNDVIIQQVANVEGASTVDLAKPFRGHESELTWFPSDIHPTNAGHQVIADAVWQATGYDTEPPRVSIERPQSGPLQRAIPTIVANVTDRVGVTAVSLWINGELVGDMPYIDELDAYATLWDTRGHPPGQVTLEVRASDAAGNEGSAEVEIETVVPEGQMPVNGTPEVPAIAD